MNVTTKRSKKFVKAVFKNIPLFISGKKIDRHGIGRVFWATFIHEMFDKIHDAYAIKALGGTDSLGNSWPPLARETIAQRPVTGQLRRLGLTAKRTGTAFKNRERGLLSPQENILWKVIFSKTLRNLQKTMKGPEAKSYAARIAWTQLKKLGAMTKLDKLGSRNVKIMRLTDKLFDSLEPSQINRNGYRTRRNQLVVKSKGSVRLGTKVKYAKFHNKTRPVIPEDINKWVEEATKFALNEVNQHILRSVIQ